MATLKIAPALTATATEEELAPEISQLRRLSEPDIYEGKIPTDDPKPEIIEGHMSSDYMDIPIEVDKKEAHELSIYPDIWARSVTTHNSIVWARNGREAGRPECGPHTCQLQMGA
ncbi:hypothetical protein WG936_07725 [Corynebacterium sp. H127]|uniref:hypothetical protein n=1 Tax=Corynebacterium sp. H127 TaxID=3133418 RepID=UPI0030B66A7B